MTTGELLSMDWPQYTSMEHLLATKQGKFGTLSIVVRLSSSELSRRRVNLASVGLAPVAGAGHAAIVHEFEGSVHAFFTSPEHPYSLGFSDRVPGDGRCIVRTRELKERDVDELNAAMGEVVERECHGLTLWTPIRTSAAFASTVWMRTFGEKLEHRSFGFSTADNLGRSILEFGHRERAFLRRERDALDLSVSERISELLLEDRCREQGMGRGLGL